MGGAVDRPVDLAMAMRWLGGDRKLLRELVGIFVDDGPKRLDALRAAMAAADAKQIEHIAHSLKGSAAILGAARLRDAALVLEDSAHDRHGDAGAPLVAQVAREVERVIAFFADPSWPDRLDVEAAS